ncbi:MAG: hypothetical protein IPO08_23405 [Xanthomonadales bacterium]|nr:hypothetical protein [Xanthomonadales bacterium]
MQISNVSVNQSPSFSALLFGGLGYPIEHKPPRSAIRRVNLLGDDRKTLSEEDDDDGLPLSKDSLQILEMLQSEKKALLKTEIAEKTKIHARVVHKALLPLTRRGLVFSSNSRPSHYTHDAALLKGLERIKRIPPATLAVIEKSDLMLKALAKTPTEFRKMHKVFEEIKKSRGDMRATVDRLVTSKAVVKEIRKCETWLKIAAAGVM